VRAALGVRELPPPIGGDAEDTAPKLKAVTE
jgi:hypothetical protein